MNEQNYNSLVSEINFPQKQFICDICQKEFFSKIHYHLHTITHLIPEHFNCDVCQDKFTHILSLDKHLQIHNSPMCIICGLCNKEFFDEVALNEHTKEHNSECLLIAPHKDNEKIPIKVNRKGKLFLNNSNRKPALNKYTQKRKDNSKNHFMCNSCDKEFSEKHVFDEHYQNHCYSKELNSNEHQELVSAKVILLDNFQPNNNKLASSVLNIVKNAVSYESFSTEIADENLQSPETVKTTIIKIKAEQNESTSERPLQKFEFVCEVCQKVFLHKQDLTIHFLTHTNKKPILCKLCGKTFALESLLNSHLRHHKRKKFSCGVCKKKFSSKGKLFNHVHTHAIVKSFTCDICQLEFSEKCQLEEHRLTHNTEKKDLSLTCKVCEKKFSTKKILNAHMHLHSESCPFVCDICSRKFSASGNLRRHYLIHTGEKPFECETCGARFNQKVTLTNHYLVHTEEAPIECKLCGACFSHKSSLTKHQLIHQPPRENVTKPCSLCPEGYTMKTYGNSQLCVHMQKKPFKCKRCGKHFVTKQYLELHQYIHSGDTP